MVLLPATDFKRPQTSQESWSLARRATASGFFLTSPGLDSDDLDAPGGSAAHSNNRSPFGAVVDDLLDAGDPPETPSGRPLTAPGKAGAPGTARALPQVKVPDSPMSMPTPSANSLKSTPGSDAAAASSEYLGGRGMDGGSDEDGGSGSSNGPRGSSTSAFPMLLPPRTAPVGMQRLQGAVQSVKKTRRQRRAEKRQAIRAQVFAAMTNGGGGGGGGGGAGGIFGGGSLVKNGLASHPSLHSQLPPPLPRTALYPRGPSRRTLQPASLHPIYGPSIGPSPAKASAARAFDERHSARLARAQAAYGWTVKEFDSPRTVDAFGASTNELRRNRFYFNEKVGGSRDGGSRKEKAKSTWKLESSIWGPRRKGVDSNAYWDTEEVRSRMFLFDWELARNAHQLEKFILSNTLGDGLLDADGDGKADEIEEVRTVLWEHSRLIYGIFNYYASLGSVDDIFHIYLNGYLALVEDCALAVPKSRRCQRKDLDQLFVHVNAKSAAERAAELQAVAEAKAKGKGGDAAAGGHDQFNKSRALNRQEFLQVLVRIAVMKYIASGQMSDVSDALATLFRVDFDPRLPAEVHQDSDAFRQAYCYTEAMDRTLKKWESSFRTLYGIYAAGDGALSGGSSSGGVTSNKYMDYPEWLKLCKDLRLIDAEFTRKEATLAFVWSRLSVINEANPKSRIRLTHLTFEDFMEALIRISLMKSLPLDDEVAASGCADGGQYLLELQEHPALYAAFLRDHSQRWDAPPLQPAHRCLEHLAALLVRTVEEATKGGSDGVISLEEARRFHRGERQARSSADSGPSAGARLSGRRSAVNMPAAVPPAVAERASMVSAASRDTSPSVTFGGSGGKAGGAGSPTSILSDLTAVNELVPQPPPSARGSTSVSPRGQRLS